MKRIFLAGICALLFWAIPSQAQWGNREIPTPKDGLKDAYKDYFMIGASVDVRNITNPSHIALIKREFNSITAENAMKPQPSEPRKGEFNWADADKIADFCRRNGIKLRGHTLIWHNQIGSWMCRDESGKLLSKEEFYANMKHHIQAIVNRYKDVVFCWDVVNEAVADSPVAPGRPELRDSPMYKIAGEEFIYKAFEYAHEADPDALLFYNDYNEAEPAKSQRIYNLIKRMKDAGVPIDGIGMQGHYNIFGPSMKEVDDAISLYSKVVKHIQVTELDVRVNEDMGGGLRFNKGSGQINDWEKILHQDQYANLFKVFRKHKDVIDCVTFWNISDKDSWLGEGNYALLFDSNYKPKRAYLAVKGFNREDDNIEVLEDFKPSELNKLGQEYPMVNSQGYARFRIYAPEAKYVIASIAGGTVLHKDSKGFWTGTTAAPENEGFHYYHLTIDGAEVNDPGTNIFYGSTRWESGIEIPAHDADFYAGKNVPHGNVQQVFFWSNSTNQLRRAFVYTPPRYENGDDRYPVLYLQHGWGENEYAWLNQGHANFIMDNLLAEGKVRPFIIVMTYGMTNDVRIGELRKFNYEAFQTVLCDELIPFIDSNFRTIAQKDSRAMAGLSMGGMETHNISLARPEMFSYYGLMSGGIYLPDEIQEPEQVKGIFIGCGSKEGPDRVMKAVSDLQAAGFNAKGYVSDGTAHEFLTWRRCLYQMAPMLFK